MQVRFVPKGLLLSYLFVDEGLLLTTLSPCYYVIAVQCGVQRAVDSVAALWPHHRPGVCPEAADVGSWGVGLVQLRQEEKPPGAVHACYLE